MSPGDKPSQTNPLTAAAAPRLCLVANFGTDKEKRITCRRVVTLLGRRQGCKVTMQHRRIAPVHVAIVNDGTRILAVDLVTSHGTLLNGLKMEYECLKDGDVLTCHPWEFRIEIQSPEQEGHADAHPFGLEPSPHVVALEHLHSRRILRPNRALCVIGRRHGCDITVSDGQVSRVHALLLSYFGRPAIFDLLSTNRTFVNEEPVQFKILKKDDVITIGESSFHVRMVDSPVANGAAGFKTTTEPTVELEPRKREADMIDIQATESSHPWRIADKMEKTNPER